MNKSELVTVLTRKTNQKRKDVEDVLNAFFQTVTEAMIQGENVKIAGFGTFEARQRAERNGRNPRKPQETVRIPAHRAPVFRAGQKLKDTLKNLPQR